MLKSSCLTVVLKRGKEGGFIVARAGGVMWQHVDGLHRLIKSSPVLGSALAQLMLLGDIRYSTNRFGIITTYMSFWIEHRLGSLHGCL